jgi:hypothetical protein
VKPVLIVLAIGALFVGVVFVGGRSLGVWEEVRQPHMPAPPASSPAVTTTLDEEVVDEAAPTSSERAARAKRKKARARWIREANALCTSAAREARVLAREYENPSGFDEVLALGEETLAGERRFLDQLAGLKRPSSERRLIRQMLAVYEEHHRFFQRTISALHRDDTAAALRAGFRAQELIEEAEDMLAFLGARKCNASEASRGSTLGVASTG